MSTSQVDLRTSRKALRLWPGIVAALALVFVRLVLPVVMEAGPVPVIGGVVCALAILVWWLFLSRAPWSERLGALVLIIVATPVTRLVVHPSVSGGLMGMMVPLYAVPVTIGPALVLWAVATRRLSDGVRRATMVAAILLACGVWTLVRTDGLKGGDPQWAWRWTPTAEERLLARGEEAPASAAPPIAAPVPPPANVREQPVASPSPAVGGEQAPAAPKKAETVAPTERKDTRANAAVANERTSTRVEEAEWPGFRGRGRDGTIPGMRIETDWSTSPPVELWRKPIGPGWSSFAVRGDLIYTQEQRGGEELVSCYRLSTGAPVWKHRDATRFYESNGGPGPRGTPTVHGDRLYTLGATGVVNALNADTGALIWSRNASTDTGAALPGWGFTSSPLVVDDLVIVAASGRLAAYDVATGNPRWTRKTLGGGYSSPHLATIKGVRQILLLTGGGASSVAPADGAVLWEHPWPVGVAIVQPAFTSDGDVLMAGGDAMGGQGIRRLAISQAPAGWSVQERWTSRGLKPYFNDLVVHKGHAYGYDGTILACIDVESGERKWKGGRYGEGQLLLLPDQDLLLLLSDGGELALVSATPDKHTELSRFPAIEGKTWNHPVLVHDILLVRNGEQMAAFRLQLTNR